MRIVTNTLSLAPGSGIDTYSLQISRQLAARGHEVHVLAQRDGELRDDWAAFAAGVTVCGDFLHPPIGPPHLRRPGALAGWLKALGKAVAAGRRSDPAVVFANDAQSLVWAVACAGSRPVVCHLHNQLGGQALGRQRRFMASRVDRFIVPSEFLGDDWVRAGLPADRVAVIRQPVDLESFPVATPANRGGARRSLGIGPSAFVVAFLGRLVVDKGLDVLLDAWRRLDLPPDEGRLVLMGQVWPPDYADRLARRAQPDRCLFLRPTRDVVPLLHAADVVVLPSLWPEAGSRVLLEAMATGCPVVASAAGASPEMLPGELAGLLVAPGDVEALAARLSSLRDWRRRDPSLGARCRDQVAARHSVEAAAEELERLFAAGRAQVAPTT